MYGGFSIVKLVKMPFTCGGFIVWPYNNAPKNKVVLTGLAVIAKIK